MSIISEPQTGWIGNTVGADIERERLHSLESLLDPHTCSILDDVVVVQRGWRVLELGAGAGSVARRMAEQVGPEGVVVAAEIEPRFLVDLPANVVVQELDAAVADFGEGQYDLIHHRAVLSYVPEREDVLRRLARALRPGGWLVSEEPVFSMGGRIVAGDGDGLVAAWYSMLCTLLEFTGTDLDFGLRLPSLLAECGLVAGGNRGLVDVATGGDGRWALNGELLLRGVQERVCALGVMTQEQVEATVAALRDPANSFVAPVGVSAWARRPA